MRGQVIDHDAKIGFGPVQPHRLQAARQPGRIQPRQQALRRRFLVSRRPVDLPRQEQPRHRPQFQSPRQRPWIDIVVFDRIARTDNPGMLQAGDGCQDCLLYVLGQTGGNAVRIDGDIVQSFRLQEDIVPLLVGEADDLVLDRGAVARPPSGDLAGIDRGLVQIRPNNGMRRLGGTGDAAFDLTVRQASSHGAERLRRLVARVGPQGIPVDRAPVQPRRRAGFQPPQRQAQPVQGLRQPNGRCFPHPSGRSLAIADMDDPAQERARRQHHRRATDPLAAAADHRRDPAVGIRFHIFHRGRPHRQVWRLLQRRLHGPPVQRPVGLRPRSAHRRPLAAVQQLEMDTGGIRDPAHQPVQRIDLPHKMAFADSADRRVARHLADRRQRMGQQKGLRPGSGGGGGGFASRMPAADNDHIVMGVHGLLSAMKYPAFAMPNTTPFAGAAPRS